MEQIDFKKDLKHYYKVVLLICFSLAAQSLYAKPAFIPYERMTYEVASGIHLAFGKEETVSFREVITVPQAKWLRVMFGECSLGSESYITITSIEDEGLQRLDANSLQQWRNRSAFFNGDSIRVDLHVAPGESGISVNIEEIVYQGSRECLSEGWWVSYVAKGYKYIRDGCPYVGTNYYWYGKGKYFLRGI